MMGSGRYVGSADDEDWKEGNKQTGRGGESGWHGKPGGSESNTGSKIESDVHNVTPAVECPRHRLVAYVVYHLSYALPLPLLTSPRQTQRC